MKYEEYEQLDEYGNTIETFYESGISETQLSRDLTKAYLEKLPYVSPLIIYSLIFIIFLLWLLN